MPSVSCLRSLSRACSLLPLVVVSCHAAPLPPLPSIAVSCPATPEGHWDCGRQVGEHFRERIRRGLEASDGIQATYHEVQTTAKGKAVFAAYKATAARLYPDYMQEINGTAHGAGQPLDLLLVANFQQELGNALTKAMKSTPDRCSDVFNEKAFAHNEDGEFFDMDTIYFVRLRTFTPEGDSVDDIAGITYPGCLTGWGPGWNQHGLAWTSNVLYAKPTAGPPLDGVGVLWVSRDMARAKSIDDAISRGTPVGLMAGQNLNIGSFREQRIVTVETAPGGAFDVLHVTKPTFHANEYLRMWDVPQDIDDPHLTSARHRHASFLRAPAPTTPAGLLSILGDTSDTAWPTFRRNDTTREYTLFTILFDIAQGTAALYRDNPRLGGQALLWREVVAPPGGDAASAAAAAAVHV